MATFTVSIPKELKDQMDEFPEVNLAEYLKKKFEEKVAKLQKLESRGEL